MFGLMKPAICNSEEKLKAEYRLHYCGTCKTIGRNFSQKSRLLLNNDIVFLGHLLSAMSGETEGLNWDKAYFSKNCFSLPVVTDKNPLTLQFAAALNIILAELKIDDNISDIKNKTNYLWKFSQKIFSAEFRKAAAQMKKWGISTEYFQELVKLQQKREKEKPSFSQPLEGLEFYSEPTAKMTGTAFEKGSQIIGKTDYTKEMYRFGFNFGKIVYILDAILDFEKDLKENSFNAIKEAYLFSENKINERIKKETRHLLIELKNENEKIINSLPLSSDKKSYFIRQLGLSLNKNLKLGLEQCNNMCSFCNGNSKGETDKLKIDISKHSDKNKFAQEKKKKKSGSWDCYDCDCCNEGCFDCSCGLFQKIGKLLSCGSEHACNFENCECCHCGSCDCCACDCSV